MTDDDTDPRPPLDTLDFNDPAAWGYCDRCCFDVAVVSGLRQSHRRIRNGSDDTPCAGSDRPPAERPAPEAFPPEFINLRKPVERQRSRKYWQRMRFVAKRKAREQRCMEDIRARQAGLFIGPLEADCGE